MAFTNLFDIGYSVGATAVSSLRDNLEFIVTFFLPAVVYVCFAAPSRSARVAWSVVSVASVYVLHALNPAFLGSLLGMAGSLLYYLFAAAIVFRLHRLVTEQRIGKDSLFFIALLLYVALPALHFRFLGAVSSLVFGWFLVLASYSYCVDIGRQRYGASFRDFVFFTFVDPALSLPERSAKRGARTEWRAVAARGLAGLFFCTLGQSCLLLVPPALETMELQRRLGSYVALMTLGLSVFIAIYWLRSGLANIRIALLEAVGFDVPAAYDRPYLARSPKEFWTRWNLYVGRWARRYIFGPLALHIARRSSKDGAQARSIMPRVVAVIATFLAIGALHDLLNLAGQGFTELVYLQLFALAALGLLLWEGLRVVGEKVLRASAVRASPIVLTAAVHLGLLHYVVLLMVIMKRI